MKKVIYIMLASVLILFAAACTKNQEQEEQKDTVYFSGTIIEMNESNAIVEPFEGDIIRSSADKISINLGDDFSSYKVGDAVKVEYSGEVMESYPAQVFVISIEKIEN